MLPCCQGLMCRVDFCNVDALVPPKSWSERPSRLARCQGKKYYHSMVDALAPAASNVYEIAAYRIRIAFRMRKVILSLFIFRRTKLQHTTYGTSEYLRNEASIWFPNNPLWFHTPTKGEDAGPCAGSGGPSRLAFTILFALTTIIRGVLAYRTIDRPSGKHLLILQADERIKGRAAGSPQQSSRLKKYNQLDFQPSVLILIVDPL